MLFCAAPVPGAGAVRACLHMAAPVVALVVVLVAAALPSACAVPGPSARDLWAPNQWPGGRQWTDAEMDGVPSEVVAMSGIEPSFRVRLYKNELVSNAARKQGFFGPLHVVKALLSGVEGGLVVDVGAHLGFVSLYAAALGHEVLAFEPHVPDYRMALASVRANPELAPRIGLYQAAVHWEAPTPVRLASGYVHKHGMPVSGTATIANVSGDAASLEFTTVDTVSLDGMVPSGRVVDVLKVDVTGCHCHVLRSAEGLFAENRVRTLVLSVSLANKCGCRHEDDVDWLLSIGMKARVIEDGTVVAASREQLLAPRQHNLQIWVAGHVAQAQQSAGSAEVEPGTGAASGEGGSTRSEVCGVNQAANTTGLGLFLKHAKTLASAGRSDEAVEIADAVLSCHALSWEAAVAAALAGRVHAAAGRTERVISLVKEYLQATEDKLPAMLRACKRSLCLHHVTLHLRARAGALLALAHALAATGRVDEAVRYADEAVARQPAPHVYQEANDHRRAAGLEPLEAASSTPDIASPEVLSPMVPRPLCTPDLGGRHHDPERDGCVHPGTLTLVLSVFKRDHLRAQLEAALAQSLRPAEIIVWQNGNFLDVAPTLDWYRGLPGYGTPEAPTISHIHSSRNFKYLGRFLPLAALGTEYTSVWDDDVLPQRKWLAAAVATSEANGGAVVGANGRRFSKVSPMGRVYQDRIGDGGKVQSQAELVDFVGHAWVMPTGHIRALTGPDMAFLTFSTAEDAQLGFALQRRGVRFVVPSQLAEDETFVKDHNPLVDASMSDSAAQFVRHRTFCELLQAGFKPLACDDTCADAERLASCVRSSIVGHKWYSEARDASGSGTLHTHGERSK